MRKGLLATAMQAALAERELSSMKVQADSIRLGNLSWANSGHLGETLLSISHSCLHNIKKLDLSLYSSLHILRC